MACGRVRHARGAGEEIVGALACHWVVVSIWVRCSMITPSKKDEGCGSSLYQEGGEWVGRW